MTAEFQALTIFVFSFAAVMIWNKIRFRKRVQAIETRLDRVQKHIDVLQMQESRRLLMELNANSKTDAHKNTPDDAPIHTDRGDVVRLMPSSPPSPMK